MNKAWHPKVKRLALKNGMTLAFVKTPSVRTHISLLFRGGPLYENDDTWGLSHFLEHMVFRGSRKHKDAHAVSLASEKFGGEIGGATYRDRVIFDTRSDEEKLGEAFSLLNEMLFHPRLEGIDVEREVVHEELLEAYDEEGQQIDADNLAFEHLFQDSSLGRSIDGSLENLAAFDKKSLRSFHRACYQKQGCVLAVAGPLKAKDVFAAAKAVFDENGHHAASAVGTSLPTTKGLKKSKTSRVHVVKTESSQTQMRLLFRTAGFDDRYRDALSLLARVLDDGPSSRFQNRLIDGKGLAYALWAATDSYRSEGCFELGAQVQHAKVGDLCEAFVDELCDVREKAPSIKERRLCHERFARELFDLQDQPQRVSDSLARSVSLGEPFDPAAWQERMEALKAKTLKQCARDVFRKDNCVLVLVGKPRASDVRRAKAALERLT